MIDKAYNFCRFLWWDIHNKYFWFQFLFPLFDFMPGESGNYLRVGFLKRYLYYAGEGLRINKGNIFFHSEKVTLGNNFLLNIDCVLEAAAGIEIGNDVSFGPGCKVWSISHEFKSKDSLISQQAWVKSDKITIGNDVWLGANVIVLPESSIPDGCVVGAGAIITKHSKLQPYGVYVGNPLRLIKQRS